MHGNARTDVLQVPDARYVESLAGEVASTHPRADLIWMHDGTRTVSHTTRDHDASDRRAREATHDEPEIAMRATGALEKPHTPNPRSRCERSLRSRRPHATPPRAIDRDPSTAVPSPCPPCSARAQPEVGAPGSARRPSAAQRRPGPRGASPARGLRRRRQPDPPCQRAAMAQRQRVRPPVPRRRRHGAHHPGRSTGSTGSKKSTRLPDAVPTTAASAPASRQRARQRPRWSPFDPDLVHGA
jgi:hypothetical protein